MNINTNAFRHYRKSMNMPLHDVAHILNMDASNLAKVEHGTREAKPPMILLYHRLFGAPLAKLLKGTFQSLKAGWQRRSQSLIEMLKAQQPPKSPLRISCIRRFVNHLDNENNERQ